MSTATGWFYQPKPFDPNSIETDNQFEWVIAPGPVATNIVEQNNNKTTVSSPSNSFKPDEDKVYIQPGYRNNAKVTETADGVYFSFTVKKEPPYTGSDFMAAYMALLAQDPDYQELLDGLSDFELETERWEVAFPKYHVTTSTGNEREFVLEKDIVVTCYQLKTLPSFGIIEETKQFTCFPFRKRGVRSDLGFIVNRGEAISWSGEPTYPKDFLSDYDPLSTEYEHKSRVFIEINPDDMPVLLARRIMLDDQGNLLIPKITDTDTWVYIGDEPAIKGSFITRVKKDGTNDFLTDPDFVWADENPGADFYTLLGEEVRSNKAVATYRYGVLNNGYFTLYQHDPVDTAIGWNGKLEVPENKLHSDLKGYLDGSITENTQPIRGEHLPIGEVYPKEEVPSLKPDEGWFTHVILTDMGMRIWPLKLVEGVFELADNGSISTYPIETETVTHEDIMQDPEYQEWLLNTNVGAKANHPLVFYAEGGIGNSPSFEMVEEGVARQFGVFYPEGQEPDDLEEIKQEIENSVSGTQPVSSLPAFYWSNGEWRLKNTVVSSDLYWPQGYFDENPDPGSAPAGLSFLDFMSIMGDAFLPDFEKQNKATIYIENDDGDWLPIWQYFPDPEGDGSNGTGADGKSAYEIWLEQGNIGTKQDFIDSLKGEPGEPGPQGQSAYDLWLAQGNIGSQADFIAAIQGEPGEPGSPGEPGAEGKSAYQAWLDAGNTGSQSDFLQWLKEPPPGRKVSQLEKAQELTGSETIHIVQNNISRRITLAELAALLQE